MDQVTLAKNQIRAERWRTLIQTCQQSGQTVVHWCEENSINIKTYYYWLRKLRKQELCTKELPVPIPEENPVVFKQLEVASPLLSTQAAVIIRLPQATLEIADGTSGQTIQAVLLALQSVCQAISRLPKISTSLADTPTCESPLMVLLPLYRNSFIWIHSLKVCFCSAENTGTE